MNARIFRQFLLRDRRRELARRVAIYDAPRGRDEIEQYQVESFNRIWSYCLKEVPFYQQWAERHALPAAIADVTELENFPVLTKADLVARADLVFQNGMITDAYSTGGSTGTPVRFPRGAQDLLGVYADAYTARAWWDLHPFDSYVHLWGHSHLFGGSKTSKLKRWLADKAVNATRLDAYDLTEEAMAANYAAIARRNPVYLIGYTSAVFRLARYIEAHGLDTTKLTRLRGVIVTAETVSAADVTVIERALSAPVIIQYGAAEVGDVAISRERPWPLQVLWASHIVRLTGAGDLHVTTLNNRLFPVINYAIGDRALGGDVERGNALTLRSVLGRQQDVVHVGSVDGRALELSAILPVHILKLVRGITAVQFRQEGSRRLTIIVTATQRLDLARLRDTFIGELRRDHPSFDPTTVEFEQATRPILTPAGKQALFVPTNRPNEREGRWPGSND